MPKQASRPFDPEAARREAAAWLVRRDRGFTPPEQDDYLQWLREDPAHPAFLAEQEATLRRMTGLSSWRPELSAEPDPDLFAPARHYRRWWWPAAAGAAAAAAFLAVWWRRPPPPPGPVASHLVAVEPRVLPDGSRFELREGSAVDDRRYSLTLRRLTLVGGEAAFTVKKDASHPFVVEAGGVAVRALGTVFDVRLESDSVEVLVSEGQVRVESGAGSAAAEPGRGPLLVGAGERAVIPRAAAARTASLSRLAATELSDDLAWRSPRFQFFETPLGEAVDEFNRRNRAQITLTDPGLRSLPIGGTFRADNVEGFVRILESAAGVRSAPDGAGGFTLAAASLVR